MKEIKLEINGKEYTVTIEEFGSEEAQIKVNDKTFKVGLIDLGEEIVTESVKPVQHLQETSVSTALPAEKKPKTSPDRSSTGGNEVLAPLPGLILNVIVNTGDKVTEGQRIMVMEAMKMENDVNSPRDGVVKSISVKNGDNISEGEVLAVIE